MPSRRSENFRTIAGAHFNIGNESLQYRFPRPAPSGPVVVAPHGEAAASRPIWNFGNAPWRIPIWRERGKWACFMFLSPSVHSPLGDPPSDRCCHIACMSSRLAFGVFGFLHCHCLWCCSLSLLLPFASALAACRFSACAIFRTL
jgi:hypothetical protein